MLVSKDVGEVHSIDVHWVWLYMVKCIFSNIKVYLHPNLWWIGVICTPQVS